MRPYNQFPPPDFQRLDTPPYGLRARSTRTFSCFSVPHSTFRLPRSTFIPSSALQWLPHHEGHEDILLLFRPAFPFRLPASTFRVQSGNGQHITIAWDACLCEPVSIWVACLVKGVNEFALRTGNNAATLLQAIHCHHHHRPCLYRTWDRNGQCRVLLDRCFACRCKHCSSSVFLLS